MYHFKLQINFSQYIKVLLVLDWEKNDILNGSRFPSENKNDYFGNYTHASMTWNECYQVVYI